MQGAKSQRKSVSPHGVRVKDTCIYTKTATCVRQLGMIQITRSEIRIKLMVVSVTSCVLAPGVKSVQMSVSIPSLGSQAGIVKSPHFHRQLLRSPNSTIKRTLFALPPNPKKHLPSGLIVHQHMIIGSHRCWQMVLLVSTLMMSSSWHISRPLLVRILLAVYPFGLEKCCNSPYK